MPTYSFDHIHLRSPDPEAAAAAWTAAFGAEIKTRLQVPAGIRLVLDLCGVPLFLEQVPQGTHAPPAPGRR